MERTIRCRDDRLGRPLMPYNPRMTDGRGRPPLHTNQLPHQSITLLTTAAWHDII